MKEGLKYVVMECGELSVMKDGIRLMLTLPAHKWGIQIKVQLLVSNYKHSLLYFVAPVIFHNSTFGDGKFPIMFSNFVCGGWETNLNNCGHIAYPQFNCSRTNVAGMLCGHGRK